MNRPIFLSFCSVSSLCGSCAGSFLLFFSASRSRGSGCICLNGAAARSGQKGDRVIIMAYADVTPEEAKTYRPRVVFVGDENEIIRVADYEKHGELKTQE